MDICVIFYGCTFCYHNPMLRWLQSVCCTPDGHYWTQTTVEQSVYSSCIMVVNTDRHGPVVCICIPSHYSRPSPHIRLMTPYKPPPPTHPTPAPSHKHVNILMCDQKV